MLILFLDDQALRHHAVEKCFQGEHTVLHAYNADEAIELILSCKERIGLAMLDHDLGDFAEVDGRKIEKHGVYFLNRMFADVPKEKLPAQFVVHSHNDVGRKNMFADLVKMDQVASILSFSTDNLKLIVERIKAQ